MGFLKDMSELSVVVVSGDVQAELKADNDATAADIGSIIQEATVKGRLQLEIGSVSKLDGDVIIYKRDDVSDENKELYFKTLEASTNYRIQILNAVKDAGKALFELAQ